MRVFLLHGANATETSWSWMNQELRRNGIDSATLGYRYREEAHRIVEHICEVVDDDVPTILIGHSLGGLISWHVADRCPNVVRGASIGTPWGGSFASMMLSPFIHGHLCSTISRSAPWTKLPRERGPKVPWLNVVTTRGIFPYPPNDGVVEVSSQRAIRVAREIVIDSSHTEVLQDKRALDAMLTWISPDPDASVR